MTSAPAGTYDPATGAGYLFAVGADGAIWYQGVTGGQWSGWYGLGGLAASEPAVVARVGGLDVFVVGGDLAMWRQRWNGCHLVGLAGPRRRVHLQPRRHHHPRLGASASTTGSTAGASRNQPLANTHRPPPPRIDNLSDHTRRQSARTLRATGLAQVRRLR